MQYEKMKTCADMTLADVIEDLSAEENISLKAARDRVLESKAYGCLYDFETGMWKEGPDYFRDVMNKCETGNEKNAKY